MRILFSYIGGLGHFYPLVPLARAAAEAGHVVAVAGSGRLTTHVETAGFEALATSSAQQLMSRRLLTIGRHLDPAEFGPQPAHVRIERFVPQDEALRGADLVVYTAGPAR